MQQQLLGIEMQQQLLAKWSNLRKCLPHDASRHVQVLLQESMRAPKSTQDSFAIAAQNTVYLDLYNLSACVNALKLRLLIRMSHA